MKVVLATQTYEPVIGGEERHVKNLGRELVKHGHEVHVATQTLDGVTAPAVNEAVVSQVERIYNEVVSEPHRRGKRQR